MEMTDHFNAREKDWKPWPFRLLQTSMKRRKILADQLIKILCSCNSGTRKIFKRIAKLTAGCHFFFANYFHTRIIIYSLFPYKRKKKNQQLHSLFLCMWEGQPQCVQNVQTVGKLRLGLTVDEAGKQYFFFPQQDKAFSAEIVRLQIWRFILNFKKYHHVHQLL